MGATIIVFHVQLDKLILNVASILILFILKYLRKHVLHFQRQNANTSLQQLQSHLEDLVCAVGMHIYCTSTA